MSSPTPQFKSINYSCSAYFMVQLSHPYTTAAKAIALTIQTFVSKVMSPLFNMLSRFVIAFFSKSEYRLTLWLQSLSAVIFGVQENKICHCFYFSPSICHEVMGPGAMIFVFLNVEFQASLFTLLFYSH